MPEGTVEPTKDKRYDDEETREETAQRITAKRTNTLRQATKAAREQFARHVRHLSQDQRRMLASYMRRDFEQTIGVIEDAGDELPEFTFMPDHPEL